MEKGIESIKFVVSWGLSFVTDMSKALDDGKFKWHEALRFVDDFRKMPKLVENIHNIKDELNDLSSDERAELIFYVQQEFDIDNDKVEQAIEDGIEIALNIWGKIEKYKK